MKKLLILAALLGASVLSAQTTTYTGTVRDLTGAAVTSGKILFTLNAPSGGNIPGTGAFVATTVSCTINASGAPKSSADGTSACTITNNTALTPTGTSYQICIQPYFATPGSCYVTYATGGTVDISTLVPTPATMPSYGLLQGPAGPAGPTGPTGPTGPQGPISIPGVAADGLTPAGITVTGATKGQSFTSGGWPVIPHSAYSYPGNYAGIADVVYNPNNPAVAYGAGGSFDAGETRDMKIVRTYGHQAHEYYMFYTGAALTVSPYNPTIGLAYSDDGLTWTKAGQVIPSHGSCGGTFSPGAYYDYAGTGILYIYVSCIASASQWYSGPINIYTVTVANGSSWTNSANYTWQSGPTLSVTQAWEGTQGVYAPDVIKVGSNYEMFYSSATSGGGSWNIGAATASSPLGPWTKYVSNPVTQSTYAEEPAIAQLDNGNLVMFSDTLALSLGTGFSIYTTSSTTGLTTPWTWQQFLLKRDGQTWDANHIGSSSVVEMPDGRWLIAFGANSGGTDQIGTAMFTFRTDVESSIGNSVALQTSYQEYIPNTTGGYPIRVSYRAKGYQFVGDASNDASGEVILGDMSTLAANVGMYRGTGITPLGNWLNLDGYDGLNINVGNAAFGSKTNAIACTIAGGCQMKLGITVSGGVGPGTGIHHQRGVIGCSTAAAVGATCTSAAFNWLSPAFANTNYTLACSIDTPTGVPVVSSVTKTASTFSITIAAMTAAAATGTYDCIAMHD
jgi:predicted GH43/DUF377 family glycosyl hydrolase